MTVHIKVIDTAGIAALTGLTREHVTDRIIKRPDFPAPIGAIKRLP